MNSFSGWKLDTTSTQARLSLLVGLVLCATILTNCTRDPNVRKQKYYQSATQYFEKGKFNEATLELRNAIRIDPRYAEAHYLLSQSYLRLGLTKLAVRELLITVELEPHNLKAQVDMANALLVSHQYDQADEKARMVLSQDPQIADAHVVLAGVAAARGHLDQAQSEMKESLRLAPTAVRFMTLAVLENRSNAPSEAEESFKRAISLDPWKAGPVIMLGGFYVQQHRFDEGEQQFRHAIELEPKNPSSRKQLVLLYMIEGQKDKAEQTATETKQSMKEISEGYRMLGDFYLMTGQQEKALAEYASLCREHPDDLTTKKLYIGLLVDKIDKNAIAEAATLNDEILKKNPNDVGGLIERGLILIREKRANDAIAPLQAALKIEPDNGTGHYFLGLAFNELARPDVAESEWRKAAQLRPDSQEAQKGLAEVALRRGNFTQLEESAEALIKLTPSSPLGYVYRAAVKASRKDLPGTEADLKQAIQVAPKNPAGYIRMGQLLVAERRWKDAEQAFEEALGYGPDSGEAMRGLASVYLIQKEPAKAIARINQQITKVPEQQRLVFASRRAPGRPR